MKISIITVCKNDLNGLKRTVDSVSYQTYRNIEHIIVDGASIDETVEWLGNIADDLSRLKFISEPDSGIYNAMNKGINLATGNYLLFLNAGDIFIHYNILKIIEKELQCDQYDLVYGNCLSVDPFNGEVSTKKGKENPTPDYFCDHALLHQAIFYRKELFDKFGCYNEKYKIVSDNMFNKVVFCDNSVTKKYLDLIISIFFSDGISSAKDGELFLLHQREREEFESECFTPLDIKKVEKRKKVELRRRKKSIIRFFIKLLTKLYDWVNKR